MSPVLQNLTKSQTSHTAMWRKRLSLWAGTNHLETGVSILLSMIRWLKPRWSARTLVVWHLEAITPSPSSQQSLTILPLVKKITSQCLPVSAYHRYWTWYGKCAHISTGKLRTTILTAVCSLSEPAKVSNLNVSNYTDTYLQLKWTQPTGGVKEYVVWTINGEKVYVYFFYHHQHLY